MHSRIIALNGKTNEDEMFEKMDGRADYVTTKSIDERWGIEILESIGTVDMASLTFKADIEKVKARLEEFYKEYQESIINSFDDYVDSMKAYVLRSTIEPNFDVRIYSDYYGYPTSLHEFLRDLYYYKGTDFAEQIWSIDGIYDYHY